MYGGPWSSRVSERTFVWLLIAFLIVALAVAGAAWLVWKGSRVGGVLAMVLLPVEAVFWIGFALPISWGLRAARGTDDMDRLASQLAAGHKAASEQNAASVRPADAAEVVKLPVGRRKSPPEQGIWLPEATQYFASFRGPSRDTWGHRLEGLPKMSPSWAPSAQWRRASSTPDMHPPARQDVTPSRALVRHARRGSAGSLRDSPRPPGALPS